MSSLSVKQLMEIEIESHRLKRKPRAAIGPATRLSADSVRNAFVLFDSEDCQYLPLSDLPLLLRAVGIVDDGEVEFVPREKRGFISFQEFRQLVNELSTPENSLEEAGRVFALMDPNGKGILDVETLCAVFAEAGSRMPRDTVEEMLKYCDVDGNGVVTQTDFVAAMNFISELEN
jgi:Ca2+-binding EF-hand superfamily protein